VRATLATTGLTADALSEPPAALLARLAARSDQDLPTPEALEEGLLVAATTQLQEQSARLGGLDPALAQAFARTEAAIREAIGRLTGRYRGVLAGRDAVAAERVARLRAALLPEGLPQERVHSLPWYAARHGLEAFVGRVMASIDPDATGLVDVELEG
jgi:hypothetical protein